MKRKVLICFMVMLVMSAIGCESQEKGISVEEYNISFESIILPYETQIEDSLNFSLFHMIDVNRFDKYYSNIEFSQNLEESTKLLEQMLIGFSELGTMSEDAILLGYQSNIEIALEEMKQVYKNASVNKSFTSRSPSQFTLYADVFKMMKDLSVSKQTYYENAILMMETIHDKGIKVDQKLLGLLGDNRMRFNYIYTVLATQVSTYQDFTGISVNPRRSEFQRWDDKFYRVSELDPVAMNDLVSYLEEEINYLAIHQFSNETEKDNHVKSYLDITDTYSSYFGIRSQFPSDFFLSGDYREYQKLTKNTLEKRIYSIGIGELDIDAMSYYTFDSEKYSDYDFDILDEMYLKLQRTLFNSNHQSMLFYEDRELHVVE